MTIVRPPRPVIVAHRGLHAEYPENSREAMRAAWAAGVAWAECDVHECATGPLFVLHDDTLDRTTDATGPLAARIDAELDGVRLRDAAGRVTAYGLPRLADLLADVPLTRHLLVEVKGVADYAALAREVGGRPVSMQSFDPDDLRRVAEHSPLLPSAFLVGTPAALAASVGLPYAAVHVDHRLLDATAHARLTAAGKSIGVWTVNAEADLRRVVGLGVAMLITDEPALARDVVDALCGLQPTGSM